MTTQTQTILTAATASETIYGEIRRTDLGPTLIGDMLQYLNGLTPQNSQTIAEPYHLAGFSLRDAEILGSFAAQYQDTGNLTHRQLAVASNRLPKYWRQLAHWYNFTIDYQFEPEKDPANFKIRPKTTLKTKEVAVAHFQLPTVSKSDPRKVNPKHPRYNDTVTNGQESLTVKEFVQKYAGTRTRLTTLFNKKAWGQLFAPVNNMLGKTWQVTTNQTEQQAAAYVQMPKAEVETKVETEVSNTPVITAANFY